MLFHTQGQLCPLGLPTLSPSASLAMQPLSPLSSSGISVLILLLGAFYWALQPPFLTNCSEYSITKTVWAGPSKAERRMAIMQMWTHVILGGPCCTKCSFFSFWAHWGGPKDGQALGNSLEAQKSGCLLRGTMVMAYTWVPACLRPRLQKPSQNVAYIPHPNRILVFLSPAALTNHGWQFTQVPWSSGQGGAGFLLDSHGCFLPHHRPHADPPPR